MSASHAGEKYTVETHCGVSSSLGINYLVKYSPTVIGTVCGAVINLLSSNTALKWLLMMQAAEE